MIIVVVLHMVREILPAARLVSILRESTDTYLTIEADGNRLRAAELLQVSQKIFLAKLKEHGLESA